MGVRRKNKNGVRLANQIDIRHVASPPGQEAGILFACDGLSDAKTHNVSFVHRHEATTAARETSSAPTPFPSHR